MKIKTTKKCATVKVVAKKSTKLAEKRPAAKSATFTVQADKGKNVFLAGEFNGWDPAAKKMAFKNGVYSTTIKLAPGTYQYKFVIDGTWCADPENVNSIPNDQGTFNSVITIK